MNVYVQGTDHDALIVQWWMKMRRDGDLEATFTKAGQSLSALFTIVAPMPQKTLLFEADDVDGIWFAMWFEQMMNGYFAGAWVARERRKSRMALHALLDAWEAALTTQPVVFGVTKQERILGEHERLGYTICSRVPGLWDGQDAWLMMLTREAFVKALPRFRKVSPKLEEVMARG